MTKNVSLVIAVVALLVGSIALFHPAIVTNTVERIVGSAGSPEKTETQVFYGGVSYGALTTLAPSNTGIETLTAAQICSNDTFLYGSIVQSSSITFPIRSDLVTSCLGVAGAKKDIFILNTSSSGRIVLYGNTSTTLTGIASSGLTSVGTSTSVNFGGHAIIRLQNVGSLTGEIRATVIDNGL